jgi:lactam utilization protein B
VKSIDGARVPMRAQTLCVHSDTPNAAKIAGFSRKLIDQR